MARTQLHHAWRIHLFLNCLRKSAYNSALTACFMLGPTFLLTACMDLQYYLSLEAMRITLSLPDVVPYYRRDDVYQELVLSPPNLSFSGFDHSEQGKYAFKLDRLVGSSKPHSDDEGRLAAARSVRLEQCQQLGVCARAVGEGRRGGGVLKRSLSYVLCFTCTSWSTGENWQIPWDWSTCREISV